MFLSELKRRNVLREVGVYSVIAWVLLQVVDVLLEPLEWPLWVMSTLTYLAMFGVIAAFIFAWRYDVTTHGIVRSAPKSGESDDKPVTGIDYGLMVLLLFVVVGTGYGMSLHLREIIVEPDELAAVELPSNGIAVLPFANLNGGPDFDYFGDGVADTVLNTLSSQPELKVTARSSTFQYNDKYVDVRVIGRELNVGNVLEGSIQFAGDRIRVIARLVDAASGVQKWSRTFGGSIRDVFAIQDEIAGEVAGAMAKDVSGVMAAAPSHGTRNMDAYREYLLGMEAQSLSTTEGTDIAIVHFERAIELDPDYVLAFVGLADTLLTSDRGSDISSYSVNELLDTALSIDPESPDALASRGLYLHWRGRSEDAEYLIREAIKKKPSLLKAYTEWGNMLGHHLGRLEESLVMARKAIELDPIASVSIGRLAGAYMRLGDTANAATQYLKLVEYYPDNPRGYDGLSIIAAMENRLDISYRAILRARELDPGNPDFNRQLAYHHLDFEEWEQFNWYLKKARESTPNDFDLDVARINYHMDRGEFADAQAIIDDILATRPWWLAQVMASFVYANLGQEDLALKQIKKGAQYRMGPDFDSVESNSFWLALNYAELLKVTGKNPDLAKTLANQAIAVIDALPRQATGLSDIYAYLINDDHERALATFEEVADQGWQGPGVAMLKDHWALDVFAPLRGNPRFEAAIQRIRDDRLLVQQSIQKRPQLDDSDYAFLASL